MCRKKAAAAAVAATVVVRAYDEKTVKREVEEMERKCDETGKHSKPVMVSDLLGDPVRRVRHFASHTMLVAEYGEGRRMVGVVRGCVKTMNVSEIDAILTSRNSLGTFIAVPIKNHGDRDFPPDFAILSVWSTKDVFRLQLPSFPNVFDKFWVYFLYGMHMEGKDGPRLMKSLSSFVHNIGRYDVGCGALAAELIPSDSVALAVPHWRRLSWAQDLWCLNKLYDESEPYDWTRSRSSSSSVIFADPRDI